ncbi:glycerol dehydrogenase [Propionibacterium australiense]|uniref:Glycerol dehydrogenase n=1 Tax=Propionibacterium australiense TaxID=119981 RepID=A0A383S5W8_9ACTN|nr:glycerol dehydrogenase [Propionibacterium australiense]RLP07976.1 iron-containing alcohol dehydrogenase [Propionibacterium australiense]RLP08792.1 iron-containing alcohol dehydrogenase [Propionibacterium australiense]SYZ33378.1 glycerol dehydrogenase [Propionibacterium australiense]VEH89719.1 Glycerol dehydrogenase [Propionibacterium australiense]
MTRTLVSPGSYVQGRGEMANLARYCQSIGATSAYLIVGPFVNATYNTRITASFEPAGLSCTLAVFGGECSREEFDRHAEPVRQCDVVIGIGGGKTLDTAKAVAHYAGLPVIIAPTTASTDAPCSRLSVVYTPDGAFESYLFLPANPVMVVMDLDIIVHAPVRFLVAGMGDALATYYEADACRRADAQTMAGGRSTNAAHALSRLCLDTLLDQGNEARIAGQQGVITRAFEAVVEANTLLSGIGFESSGLAGAHAIHNGLTALERTHQQLHGEKVAYGTLAQLVLEAAPREEFEQIVRFCRTVGLPTRLADIGLDGVSDDELMRVAEAACAPEDTMGNMPFVVSPYDVFAALRAADALSAAVE